MKKNSVFDYALVGTAILLIFGLAIGIFLSPHPSFSKTENRPLTLWSPPSLKDIANGSFSKHLNSFYTDQFPFRSSFTLLKANTERSLGKKENNHIIFAANGYLIPRYEYTSLTTARENLLALQQFESFISSRDIPLTVAFVPRSIDVMEAALPPLYSVSRSAAIFELFSDTQTSISLSLTKALRSAANRGERVWYKTDHHWTVYGAYLAYEYLASELQLLPYSQDYFSPVVVSENFLGTSYSSSGGISDTPDTITLFRYPEDTSYLIQNQETGEISSSFYEFSALQKKDQYQIFMGGNYGRLTVSNPSTEEKPRLLLIKDSFANCAIPFLALHFDLDIVDLRYYSKSPLRLINSNPYDHILILQGIDTLATDTGLSRLLY